MTKRRKRVLIVLAIVLAVPAATLLAALLYLQFGDLDAHRPRVERIVTAALGRDFRIAGPMRIDAGFTTRIVAGGVTLANPEWASGPAMVSIDRVEASIELLPLLSRTLRLPAVEIEGVRVSLESGADGVANWTFATPPRNPDATPGGPLGIELGTVSLADVRVVYRSPGIDRPMELEFASADLVADDADDLNLEIDGAFDDTPITLSGRIGPLSELLSAGAVGTDLDGRMGDVEVGVRLEVADLRRLEGIAGEIEIHGPDLADATRRARLPAFGEGPFEIGARLTQVAGGSSVALDVALDELSASGSGILDSILAPGSVDVSVRASGPDLAAVGALVGVDRLPSEPFRIEGHVVWAGFPATFEGVEIEVGDNRASIDGTVGALPDAIGTDLRVDASGPDLSALASLAGIKAPAERFGVGGRVLRVGGGLRFEEIEARVGATVVQIDGTLGDPPERAGSDIIVRARVPDPSVYSELVGQPLPAMPLELDGRLRARERTVELETMDVRLGENTARIAGRVGTAGGLAGTDLRVETAGPGLSWIKPWIGETASRIPDGAYRVSGGVAVLSDAYLVRDLEVRLGEIELTADGRVGRAARLAGTELRLEARGPDLSFLATATGIDDLPAEPFSVSGAAGIGVDRTTIERLDVAVGGWAASSSGTLTHVEGLSGSTLKVEARGPLSALEPFVNRALPDIPLILSGAIALVGGAYRAEGLEVTIDRHRMTLDGVIDPSDDLAGTDVLVTLSGPDLREVGVWLADAGVAEIPELPAEPFSLDGGLSVDAAGYAIRELDVTLGPAKARVDGRVGRPPEFRGSDLTIDADGPNASMFEALTGVGVPVAPFRVAGRLGRSDEGFLFRDLRVGLADYRLRLDGVLGDLPELYGTDIDVHAEGPGLALIADLADRDDLPDLPFLVDGHFEGDTRRFKLEQFSARVGSSDVRGSFRLDLEETPRLEGRFVSDRIDLPELFPTEEPVTADDGVETATLAEVRPEPPARSEPPSTRISRDPLDLGFLEDVNADVSWSVTELAVQIGGYSDLEVHATLEDGSLHVGPYEARGANGGQLLGELWAAVTADGLDFRTDFAIEGGRLDVSSAEDDPMAWPSIDVDVVLEARGRSLHELASATNGRILAVVGEGAIDSSIVDLIAADFIQKVLETLSPFRQENPASTLECAVVVCRIDEGVARIEPVAVQTDTLTVLGAGKIELGPEILDLEWEIKPRKGIGFSASTLTNPYIKVGGTLARPRLEMKPVQAVTSTGFAVATGGLSILGKGLWDRITAERKVCQRAIERAEREDVKREQAKGTGKVR